MASTCSSSKLSSGLSSFWWGERRDAGQYAHIQITVIKRMTIMNHPSHTGLFSKKHQVRLITFFLILFNLSPSPLPPLLVLSPFFPFLPSPFSCLLLPPPLSLLPLPFFFFLSLFSLLPFLPSSFSLSLSFSLSHTHISSQGRI